MTRPEGAPHAWWLEEAVRMILRYRQAEEKKKLYDVSTVGARIRTAREIRGLTQVQLAGRILKRRNREGKLKKMFGWDIHGWETGARDLPYELVGPLCAAIGVTKEWLLGDTDEGGPPMPKGLRVRQVLTNWSHESWAATRRAIAKAELERLRGLRGEGATRIHHLKERPADTIACEPRPTPSKGSEQAEDSAAECEQEEAASDGQEAGE